MSRMALASPASCSCASPASGWIRRHQRLIGASGNRQDAGASEQDTGAAEEDLRGGLCSPAHGGDTRAANPASLPGLRAGAARRIWERRICRKRERPSGGFAGNGSGRGGYARGALFAGARRRRGRRGGFGSGAPSRIRDAKQDTRCEEDLRGTCGIWRKREPCGMRVGRRRQDETETEDCRTKRLSSF